MGMNSGDKIPGLLAQSIGGPKLYYLESAQFVVPGTTYGWSPPVAGRYKFVAWGPGGESGNTNGGTTYGGSSGAYGEVTRLLAPNQVVSVAVGTTGPGGRSPTTITFPDGSVCTAAQGGSNGAAGGAATGFDVNINGSLGGNSTTPAQAGGGNAGGAGGGTYGGAGAPANAPYVGASGSGNSYLQGSLGPGAGAGTFNDGAGGSGVRGGPGLVLVQRVG